MTASEIEQAKRLMSLHDARVLLNERRSGADIPLTLINHALILTGDLDGSLPYVRLLRY